MVAMAALETSCIMTHACDYNPQTAQADYYPRWHTPSLNHSQALLERAVGSGDKTNTHLHALHGAVLCASANQCEHRTAVEKQIRLSTFNLPPTKSHIYICLHAASVHVCVKNCMIVLLG